MDPDIAAGVRSRFTELDFAAMKDIGWEVSPVPEVETWGMMLAGLVYLAGVYVLALARRIQLDPKQSIRIIPTILVKYSGVRHERIRSYSRTSYR